MGVIAKDSSDGSEGSEGKEGSSDNIARIALDLEPDMQQKMHLSFSVEGNNYNPMQIFSF